MVSVPSTSVEVPRETAVVVGLVSGSHFVNHMYLVLFPPILGVLAAEFDVGLTALGVAMGVQAFVNTTFQLPFGYLSDNHSRTVTLGLCLGLGSLGVFVIAGAPSFEWLLVGQAVLGLGVAGHHPSQFPLISDATAEAHRGRAFSVHGFAGNLGFAAPPVIIVAITAFAGLTWRHAFALIGGVGAVYGVVAVYVLVRHVDREVTHPAPSADSNTGSLRERLRGEARALVESPAILALGVFALVASTASWGVTSFVVTLLENGYNVPSETASLTLTAMFVVGAGFILVGGDFSDRFAPGPVIVGSYALVAVFVLALSSLAIPAVAAIGAAILGGSVGSFSMPARDKLADVLSERADLGRNFAVITIGIMAGGTIAPPLFGYIIENVGFRAAFAAIAGLALLAALVTVGIVKTWGRGSVTVSPTRADD